MKTVKLGDIIELAYGKPLAATKRHEHGKYPAYGANGVKAHTNEYFYDQPSIIVGRKGSAGELTLTNGRFWPLDVTYYVKHDKSETDILYIYHLLKTLNLPSLARGVKPGINRNDIYTISISLPTVEEQRQVVARLDAAFERINRAQDLTKQNMKNTKALRESILYKQLTSPSNMAEYKLGDVCAVLGGKRLPKGEKLSDSPTGHPYVRVADFNDDGGVSLDTIKYLSHETFKKISRYIITSKDVYLSIAGTIGITGIIPENLDGANLTENACRLVPSEKVNTRYLYYFTISATFHDQALANVKQTAQPKLALTRIRDIGISLPDIKTQEQIVLELDDYFNKLQKIEAEYANRLHKLSELRLSLLREAFR